MSSISIIVEINDEAPRSFRLRSNMPPGGAALDEKRNGMRSGLRHDHGPRVGRAVRGRQVGARTRRRVPARRRSATPSRRRSLLGLLAARRGQAARCGSRAAACGSSGSARSASPGSTCSPTRASRTRGRRARRSSSRSARCSRRSCSGSARASARPRTTFALLAVALAGVALVISGGHPASIVNGSIGWGDGARARRRRELRASTASARPRMPELSPLRYTALTAALGWLVDRGRHRRRDRRRPRADGRAPPTCGRSRRSSLISRSPARSSASSPGMPRSG